MFQRCCLLVQLVGRLTKECAAVQVFEKAVTETTFGELYAELSFQLSIGLPSFEPLSAGGNKRHPSTFRSALHSSPFC